MKRQAKYLANNGRSGFSTIELLIGVIIMAILVAIIAPIVTDRTREARIAAANSDLENIVNAEERTIIDTGYVVRLFVLDDVPAEDGIGFELPLLAGDRIDGFADERDSAYWDQTKFFIDPKTHIYNREGDVILNGLIPETNFRPSISITSWHGPYLTWQRNSELPEITNNDPTRTAFDDIGDDPWGNNYMLFTREGLVREVNNETSGSGSGIADPSTAELGEIVKTISIAGVDYDTELFGEFTVLSMGPDGLPGDTDDRRFGAGDDLVRHF